MYFDPSSLIYGRLTFLSPVLDFLRDGQNSDKKLDFKRVYFKAGLINLLD